MRAATAIFLTAVMAAPVLAAEPARAPPAAAPVALSERDFLDELPVVLSVSRLAQPLDETPGAVTVLDRDIIRKSGARELSELLRLVPGFVVGGFNGANPVAGYHAGFNLYGTQLQVFVDGRSVYSTFYLGDTHRGLMGVALEDIERIEVLRGSNSAAYGANAFLGVVNIITRDAADTVGGLVSISGGDRGIDDNAVRVGIGNERAAFRATMTRRADSGWSGVYDDKRIGQLHLRGDLRPDAVSDIRLLAGAVEHSWGDGIAGNAGNPPRTATLGSAYASATLKRQLGGESELRVAAAFDHERFNDKSPYRVALAAAPPLIPVGAYIETALDYSGSARRTDVDVQHTLRAATKLRLVWGGGYRHESVKSAPLYFSDESISAHLWRLFGNAEWRPIERLIVNAGGMWEKHSIVGTRFSPRLMANLHLVPGHTLRIGVTKAHRTPQLYELRGDTRYYDKAPFLAAVVNNPLAPPIPQVTLLRANWQPPYGVLLANPLRATGAAKPEGLLSREIGYLGEFSRLRLTLDIRAFHESIESMVRNFGYTNIGYLYELAAIGNPWRLQTSDYSNRPGNKIYGWEYQAQWRPLAGSRILLAQSFQRIDSPEATERHNAPTDTTSLAWFQDLPGNWTAALVYATTGAMTWQGYPKDLLKSEHQLDLRLAKSFRLGPTKGEIAWTVQQANGRRQEFLPTYSVDRRAFATLRLEY